jgi:FixJ family two-component response regulator
VVFVVDDDPSVRAGLSLLFKSVGLDVEVFASVPDLLRKSLPSVPSCLVLDIRLPGQGGLDLQSALAKENNPIPIVFMTAHGDIPMSVEAMKAGAIDFLPKPFRDQAMLDAVGRAIESDRRRREDEQALRTVRSRYEGLTRRERDVLALVAAGLMNKQIAAEIGIAEQTVKIHRSHVMNKMAAKSVVDLARMAQMLGVRGKTLP